MKTRLNIFLAEDSSVVQHLVRYTLTDRFKCNIECFYKSSEVISKLKKSSPDLLILDYYLGSFTDQDYADKILDYTEKRNIYIPIIFFSALKDKSLEAQLYDRGVYHIVSKNSDTFVDDLTLCVDSVIKWLNRDR